MSPELRDYLSRWLAWAEAGAVTDEFRRGWGLCRNAPSFVGQELEAMFGGTVFPFGGNAYLTAAFSRTQHLDPNRLAWVREQLAEVMA